MTGRKLYQNPVQDDEIDVMLVLGNSINFIKSNFKTFILFSVLGILAGLIAFVLLPRVYKVNMLADSRILSSEEVVSIVDSWQDLIEKEEIDLLARKFNVNPSIIETIKSIEAEPSKKIIGDKDKDAFLIKAKVFDNSSLDSLQAGIIYSLKNNEYVHSRIEIQKENLQLLKSKINEEIVELDSIRLSVQQLLKSGNDKSSAFLTDPGNINLQIIELYERILGLNESERFLEEIQIIESFTRFKKPDNPKLVICVLAGFFIGLIGAVLYILIKNIQKRLNELPA